MSERGVSIEIEREGPVAFIWLNRPEVHNAFDRDLIDALSTAFRELGADADVRVIVLAGRGRSFSAGADVEWMKQQGLASPEKNNEDAMRLAEMFQAIAVCPKPTVARVHGAAIGGGMGLICACDIAVGSADAIFATSEVRLGLTPATIAPYVVRAMGPRHARRYFQTGERFDPATAQRIGVLHEVVEADALDGRVRKLSEALLAGAPQAQKEAKELVDFVADRSIDTGLMQQTAQKIAARRATDEAAEGLSAFLGKRRAAWVPKS